MLPNDTGQGPEHSGEGHSLPPTRIKSYMVTGPLSFVAVDLDERMKSWQNPISKSWYCDWTASLSSRRTV